MVVLDSELLQMMVQVFIEHIVPLQFVQATEGKGFFSIEIVLPQLLSPTQVSYEALFFKSEILIVTHQECRGSGKAFFIGFLSYDHLLCEGPEEKPLQRIWLLVYIFVHHFVSNVAVGQHLGNAHFAP